MKFNSIYQCSASFLFSIALLFLTPTSLFANSAAPGFWNAGSASQFILFHPEDKIHYDNIQMVNERISIDLYPGFAVVRGEYWMYNHSDTTIDLTVGYPINSFFDYWTDPNRDRHVSVNLDTLHGINVHSNKTELSNLSTSENWFLWENSFLAKDTTLIQVQFIVNTNETSISEGYNRDNTNGFVYLLESGAHWKQPIIKGQIRIRLNEFPFEEMKGIHPINSFVSNQENLFFYTFDSIRPTYNNNIVVAYSEHQEQFNFYEVLNHKQHYFQKVQQLSETPIQPDSMTLYESDGPFKVHSSSGGNSILLVLILVGLAYLAGIIFALVLIKYLIKKWVNRKQSKVLKKN